MCGISGFIDKSHHLGVKQLIKYNEILSHRGPDGNGYELYNNDYATIGLAQVRLSILDLSQDGKQPMNFRNLTIVFNGEVYNFKEIRKELNQLGYEFISNSDTEVVLKSFDAWGLQCVDKFIGMFAFAIYDNTVQKLYLCRDRAGVKPLYYYCKDGLFLFGSELKVFLKTDGFTPEIDINSVKTFLNYGYVTNNKTILKNVYKLSPGNWMEVNVKDCNTEFHEYWSIGSCYQKEKYEMSFEDAVSEAENLIRKSAEYRMVSDVPVGVFLSSGFDSTLITSVLQQNRTEKLKTFTIGFSDGIDESVYAKKIANYLGTDHTSYDCTYKDALELIPLLPKFYDDPIADISCIPTLLVSKVAKEHVKVALSADGGDELFGGYNGFKTYPEIISKVNKIKFKSSLGHFTNMVSPYFKNQRNHYGKKLKGLSELLLDQHDSQVYNLIKNSWGIPDEMCHKVMNFKSNVEHHKRNNWAYIDPMDELFVLGYEDVLTNLLLVKVDRASMGVSLESREPLLDHTVAEFSARLPFAYKHNGLESKRPIREIVYKYLPKEMMDRPKLGFDLPLYDWLRKDLSYLIHEYLNENKIRRSGIFSVDYVNQIIQQFNNHNLRYPQILWRLIVFQMWYFTWLENN